MDLKRKIHKELGINPSYIKVLSSWRAVCLVHSKWLQQLAQEGYIPQFTCHETLSESECELLLYQSESPVVYPWSLASLIAIPKQSGKIRRLPQIQQPKISNSSTDLSYFQLIHYVAETNYRNLWKAAWKKHHKPDSDKFGRHSELQDYNEAVKEAIKRLFGCPVIEQKKQATSYVINQNSDKQNTCYFSEGTCHPNLVPVMCAVETNDVFYLICQHREHTLHHCVMFSPAILETSTTRCLFVVYQLLQAIRVIHDLGLHIGVISLNDITIHQNLWVQILPRLWEDLFSLAQETQSGLSSMLEKKPKMCNVQSQSTYCRTKSTSKRIEHNKLIAISSESSSDKGCKKLFSSDENEDSSQKLDETVNYTQNKQDYLNSLVDSWIRGQISNFDYLMELNRLAGREMNNPKYHPVMPWIMDFSVPDGGWRDLSKSKFRLNKGDKQLDLTYESASAGPTGTSSQNETYIPQDTAIEVPHHISEVLSDITYYVYKARRMPKSVLCQHVRHKWVPAEYPSTIQRLQEWTPEECIPEFFSDSSIFYSFHEDLPDLGIPWWCQGPEDFVEKHRAALNGDHISERLHHWIDLTFGYRLSGSAAVKSKNVCLPLVDQHTTIVSSGMVQLFVQPHPHKLSPSFFLGRQAPKTFRNVLQKTLVPTSARKKFFSEGQERDSGNNQESRESGDEETSSEGSARLSRWKPLRSKTLSVPADSFRPETQTVVLPKDYNPLAILSHLESLYSFMSQIMNVSSPAEKQQNDGKTILHYPYLHHHHHRKDWDMLTLGCLAAEISLAPRLKAFPKGLSLEERYSILVQLLKTHRNEIPRCFNHVIQVLLQLHTSNSQNESNNLESAQLPLQQPPVSTWGLPPPSAHQLLQPLIHTIPFPSYFSELYTFLNQLNQYTCQLHKVLSSDILWSIKQEQIRKLASGKVGLTAKTLPSLLPKLNSEGIDLITPYLQEMFQNSHTALLAAWYLFGQVSQALGPHQTTYKLLHMLTRLFDPDVPSPKHLKLYHRTYLLQLVVRLGLQSFLAHFMALLIEATGGFRDFTSEDSPKCPGSEASETSIRKGSHLHSPELERLAQDSELDDSGGAAESISSPYDDDSSHTDPLSNPKNEGSGTEGEPEMFVFEGTAEDVSKEKKLVAAGSGEVGEQAEEMPAKVTIPSTDTTDDDKWKTDDEVEEQLDGETDDVALLPEDISEFNPTAVSPGTERHDNSLYSCSVPNLPSQLTRWSSVTESTHETTEKITESTPLCSHPLPVKRMLSPGKSNENTGLEMNISDVASESVMWLAHRLGPVLTAKYLTRNLLRMLTLCYMGQEQRIVINRLPSNGDSNSRISISGLCITGDESASRVLECLAKITALYGKQFILLQYLPHVSDLVSLCKRRISETLEASLIGAMSLVKHIIPYLSDAMLMDHLQDVLIKDILYPVVRLVSSLRLVFPGGGHSRWIVTCKLLDTIYLIGLRIGFEMTRKHLSTLLQRFFSCFDKAHDRTSLGAKSRPDITETGASGCTPHSSDDYLEIKMNCETNEYIIGSPVRITTVLPGSKASLDSLSPPVSDQKGTSPNREKALEELHQVFTPEMAYLSYIPFCKLAGGIHMEQTLKNEELIRQLCVMHDIYLARLNPSQKHGNEGTATSTCNIGSAKTHRRVPSMGQDESFVSGEFGKNVAVVGNRIDVQLGEESHLVAAAEDPVPHFQGPDLPKVAEVPKYDIHMLRRRMEDTHRHLKGNWLLYWEHEIGRSEKDQRFNFKQIKLQSFVGHTGSVRTIHVLDNENSFLTGSKDKTVKLWSLRSCGDGSAQTPCQWTYTQHRKTVFAVSFLDSFRLVGSCDSTVHIWDPFMGSCIKQLDSSKGSPVTVLTAMPAPSTSFIVATTSSTIRFLDTRTCRYMHEFKVSVGPAGLIRCLSVSPNGQWIAVGHSTGIISVLDIRTGLLYGSWMGHEGEILQLKAYNNNHFVTSSLDHSLSVWTAEDTKAKCYLRGPLEPVTSLCFYRGEVISGTTANRIGVHTGIDSQATYSSTRLRSDTFKGVLTSMAILPLNRLLLLGADNGSVVLLC